MLFCPLLNNCSGKFWAIAKIPLLKGPRALEIAHCWLELKRVAPFVEANAAAPLPILL